MNSNRFTLILTRIFFSIQIFFCFSLFGETVEISNFGTNPGKLKMLLYRPSSMPASGKFPVVVAIHGCSQNAYELEKLSGWNKIADQAGCYVIYPEQVFGNNAGWCFNWFNPGDYRKGTGENESILQMINYTKSNYNIDTTKIFLYGLSAGAGMAQAMAITHPQLFSAVALFAGTAYGLANDLISSVEVMAGKIKIRQEDLINVARNDMPVNTQALPRIYIYQGMKDIVVDPQNAYYLRDQWLGLHQAATQPARVENLYRGNREITKTFYLGPANKEVVTTYFIEDLNHRIMISPGDANNQGGHPGLLGLSSNFHSTYEVALNFQLLTGE